MPERLRKCWEKLNLHYMSEEEDNDNISNPKLIVKKLVWRSESKSQCVISLKESDLSV